MAKSVRNYDTKTNLNQMLFSQKTLSVGHTLKCNKKKTFGIKNCKKIKLTHFTTYTS